MSKLAGLALKIRSTDGMTDAETFDMANKDPDTVNNVIKSAFKDPFENTVRITLVIGAGKLERQKYHDSLPKVVVACLRDLAYEEGVDDPGTYKMQHDTGKNLKTIVIFPKLKAVAQDATSSLKNFDDMTLVEGDDSIRLPAKGSPVYNISVSGETIFQRMLDSKVQSWSQKRSCLAILDEVSESVKALQDRLFGGQPLSEFQQEFYDAASLDSLAKKQGVIKKAMAAQVEEGKITRHDKAILLEQVTGRLSVTEEELERAKKGNKPKKAEKLADVIKKLEMRKSKIDGIVPQAPQKLKTEPQISTLRQEMAPLVLLEQETKGRLLSIKEQTKMTRKIEIEEEIVQLENQAREWFEDDDSFAARVQASRDAAKSRVAKRAVTKKSGSVSSSTNKKGSSWSSTGTKKTSSWVLPAATKKSAPKSGGKKKSAGGMFAAMMDSDSDSD